ncbi:MAG: hypothetical protein LC624_09875 [Halobacteriales archaeon]|nr:hypothetical protein [Halobacteriales archaeon]
MKHIIALGALALLAMPVSMAAALVSTTDVTSALPSDAQPFADAIGTYYAADDGSIWMESNGVAGLQQAAYTDEQGHGHEADTLAFGIPAAPQMPGLPGIPDVGQLPEIPL